MFIAIIYIAGGAWCMQLTGMSSTLNQKDLEKVNAKSSVALNVRPQSCGKLVQNPIYIKIWGRFSTLKHLLVYGLGLRKESCIIDLHF